MTNVDKDTVWVYYGHGHYEANWEVVPSDPNIGRINPVPKAVDPDAPVEKMITAPPENKMITPDSVGEVRKGQKLTRVAKAKKEEL